MIIYLIILIAEIVYDMWFLLDFSGLSLTHMFFIYIKPKILPLSKGYKSQ